MNKVALVTGASRGIGRAIAQRLAAIGHDLFLMARNESALAEVIDVCQQQGVAAVSCAGELTDESYIVSAVDTALETFGQIDVLVNNAGGAIQQSVQDANLDQWRSIMDVNFGAAVSLSAKILPGMISRESGTVINISSISGRNTDAGSGIYSASKHALNGFSGCMYEDVRDYGIKVSTIMPGFVETDLTSGMGIKNDNMIRATDVAGCVEYVLSASANCCPTEIVLRPQKRL